ncbi:MAG: KpsF/GutQ family sugar-phosphate isomerase [Prevotellaceae bacterium]|jgi:arabinose-5-phosphate isomerase|nr:KpsF/GutQ family sugar-phosphate isomerase [Prevotellaceae bacterium]
MGGLSDIGKLAVKTIEAEAHAIHKMASYINEDFERVVQLIYKNKGRVIVSGIGKSAIIANKIVATFNSTGTPAVFMHAADAIHGDLGIIQPDDIVICLSKSGNTAEIKLLVPLIRNLGNKLIAIVSNRDSYLAQHAGYVLHATVDAEACPNNLAPTTSTTAQLVMGDALAICLLQLRGFTEQDFARVHPGGSLGKKLYLRVGDLIDKNRKPQVSPGETIDNTIMTISSNRLGATAVVDNTGAVVGIITDGDVRRMLEKTKRLDALTAIDIMSENPKVIDLSALAIKAFNLMEENKITQLLVVRKKEYVGMVHLHDILREGIV